MDTLGFGWLLGLVLTLVSLPQWAQGQCPHPTQLPRLRVGVFLPRSGPIVDYGSQAEEGVSFAAKLLKSQGARLEIFFEDTLGTPSGTSLAVNKLLTNHSVDILLGEMTTINTDIAIAPAVSAQVPLISIGSTYGPLIQDKPLIHLVSVTDDKQAEIMAHFAYNTLKAKRAGVLVNSLNNYSKDMSQAFIEAFLKLSAQNEAFEVPLGDNSVSYAPYIRKLKKKNTYPDVIFMPLYYDQAGPILSEMAVLKVPSKILGGDGFDSALLMSLSKDTANGVYFVSHFSPSSGGAPLTAFLNSFKKANAHEPGTFAVMGYDALMLAYDAFKRSCGAGGKALADKIASTQRFEGGSGIVSMDAKTRLPIKDAFIMKLQNGQKRWVQTAQGTHL